MSFEGQKLCEILYQAIILGHGVKLSLTLSLSLSLSSRLFFILYTDLIFPHNCIDNHLYDYQRHITICIYRRLVLELDTTKVIYYT